MEPYISVDGVTTENLLSCSVAGSHEQPTSSASIECHAHSLSLGDNVEISMGYTGDSGVVFNGYVKSISRNIPDNTYSIDLQDRYIRAVEYFIAPSNPNDPLSYSNISAEDLIGNVLAEAGLTDYDGDTSYFTFGITDPIEIKLVAAADFVKTIADLLAWHVWYSSTTDTVYFANRKPFPMDGTSGQPGDVADTPISYTLSRDNYVQAYRELITEKDLRNRVVVWGANDIYATASEASPHLPAGFYKTSLIAVPNLISDQDIAQKTADYNLTLQNKLTYSINATVPGNHILVPRSCITVNLPDLSINNETWYLYSVNHSYTSAGFLTEIEVRK